VVGELLMCPWSDRRLDVGLELEVDEVADSEHTIRSFLVSLRLQA
jgi:hypothetical protein